MIGAVKKRPVIRSVIVVAVILILAVALKYLAFEGYGRLIVKGLPAVTYDPTRYAHSYTTLAESCTFTVDLDDLASNAGREIFREGKMYIEIDEVVYDAPQRNNPGSYRIFFRAHGVYDTDGGSLVSGLISVPDASGGHTSRTTAEMSGSYRGEAFDCLYAGNTGIAYRDGDLFGYYIFPSEWHERGAVDPAGVGTVELTLTGLAVNRWTRISKRG
ncbi:MAG: hypothetical protein IJW99_04830 [Clostridia bacterium]|nr:hypothetical protein [Clostridia bacterium]